jgi:hypothetical protein
VEEEVTIPGHDGIPKVMEDRSIVLCRRFDGKMLMCVVPGARGIRTYSAVVGSWRDRIMLQPTTNSSDGKSQGGAGTMLTPTVPINIMTFN